MSDEIDLRDASAGEHPVDGLSALLDGELDRAEEAVVRRHLEGCATCRAELDEVATVRQAVRDLPTVAAPAGLVGELVDRRHRADRRSAALTLLAAALALVVAIVVADRGPGAPTMPVGAGGDSEQVALVDRTVRPFPPSPREAAPGPVAPRWDAGRPSPDVRMPQMPAQPAPPAGDDV